MEKQINFEFKNTKKEKSHAIGLWYRNKKEYFDQLLENSIKYRDIMQCSAFLLCISLTAGAMLYSFHWIDEKKEEAEREYQISKIEHLKKISALAKKPELGSDYQQSVITLFNNRFEHVIKAKKENGKITLIMDDISMDNRIYNAKDVIDELKKNNFKILEIIQTLDVDSGKPMWRVLLEDK